MEEDDAIVIATLKHLPRVPTWCVLFRSPHILVLKPKTSSSIKSSINSTHIVKFEAIVTCALIQIYELLGGFFHFL